MPWTVADVEQHKAGLTDAQKAAWVKIANQARTDCIAKGGDGATCDVQAIKVANAMGTQINAEGELQTEHLDGVELMDVGKWNASTGKIDVTPKMLASIAAANEALKAQLKPPIKIGHDKDQAWLKDGGYPSAGWVESVRVVGTKLMADLKSVPKQIAALIRAGAYRTRSVELGRYMGADGTEYPMVLRALALLGGQLPAIGSLADITKLYEQGEDHIVLYEILKDDSKNIDDEGGELQVDTIKEITNILKLEEGADVAKALTTVVEELAASKAQTETLQTEVDTLKAAADSTHKDLVTQVNELSLELQARKCDEVIGKAIDEGRIAPAAADGFKKLFASDPKATTEAIEALPVHSYQEVGSSKSDDGDVKMSADDNAVAGKLGHDKEDWAKFGGAVEL